MTNKRCRCLLTDNRNVRRVWQLFIDDDLKNDQSKQQRHDYNIICYRLQTLQITENNFMYCSLYIHCFQEMFPVCLLCSDLNEFRQQTLSTSNYNIQID